MPKNVAPSNNKAEEGYARVSFFEALKISKWGFLTVYRVDPVNTCIYLLSRILQRFDDIVYSIIFAKALDIIIDLVQKQGSSIRDLYPYLTILLGYQIYSTLVNLLSNRSRRHVRTTAELALRRSLNAKIKSLGIQTIEQPDINNKIHRAQNTVFDIIPYVFDSIGLFGDFIKAISTVLILISILPDVTVIMVLVTVPHFLIDRIYRRKKYKHWYENTEGVRISGNASGDLMSPPDLQEIISTQAFNFLDRKFTDFRVWYNSIMLKISDKSDLLIYSINILKDIVTIFGYVKIFGRFLIKKLTIGDVTFWMRMLNTLDSTISRAAFDFNDLSEFAINLKEVYTLFNTESTYKEGSVEIKQMTKGPSIEFENVSFRYPNTRKLVIKNLNLKIKSGEKIAIVGHNGAGKTTLVKLIARFYPVSRGKLLINGNNLNNINSDSLYQNMGMLLQDFNTYSYLTVKENICIGLPTQNFDETKMRVAAQTADALDFIEEYPNKFDTILNERYKGGIRPSTGQWQKIALARFFYRNAPLVIFDEPTAAIDPDSEYNIFTKIYEFFEGKTVIIISHRFSTVRNADRIIVLDKGQIVEQGTHEELLKLNGKYARGFRLQAEGYKE